MTDDLHQWTVYDSPSDFPGLFVARQWLVGPSGVRASEVTPYVDPFLENVRRFIAAVAPGSVCLMRSEDDDPVIVETWL